MSQSPSSDYILAISTVSDQAVAESLSKLLVESELVACVNLMPNITSIYQWNEAIEQTSEVLMMMKTQHSKFKALEEFLNKHHPYDIPELISCNIEQVSASYGQWLQQSLNTEKSKT